MLYQLTSAERLPLLVRLCAESDDAVVADNEGFEAGEARLEVGWFRRAGPEGVLRGHGLVEGDLALAALLGLQRLEEGLRRAHELGPLHHTDSAEGHHAALRLREVFGAPDLVFLKTARTLLFLNPPRPTPP